MANALFAKLNNVFGNPNNYSELPEQSVAKAKEVSTRLFDSLSDPNPETFVDRKRVAVIGGGFAGLSAAYYLIKSGATVELFEARDRCGGRVQTLKDFIPNRPVEAGAELIGLNHPLWLTLARELGLSLTTLTPELHYVASQLQLFVDIEPPPKYLPPNEPSVIETLSLAQLRTLHADMDSIYSQLNELARRLDPYKPWEKDNSNTLDNMSVAEWLENVQVPSGDSFIARRAVQLELENDQTISLDDQSLLGLLAAVRGGAMDKVADFEKLEELATDEENREAQKTWQLY